MKRSRDFRLTLLAISSFLFLLAGFLFVRNSNQFPIDPYWRYQGVLLARGFLEGSVSFSENSILLDWVNQFQREPISPLIVAVTSTITGRSVSTIYWTPLLLLPLGLVQALVARALVGTRLAFLIAFVLSAGFRISQFHILEVTHRVTLGFVLLFLLLYIGYQYSNTRQHRFEYGFIFAIITPVFVLSYSTLALSGIGFLFVFFGLQGWKGEGSKTTFPLIYISLVAVTYYSIVQEWLVTILGGLLPALILTLSRGELYAVVPQISVAESSNNLPTLARMTARGAKLFAVFLVGTATLLRLDHHRRYARSLLRAFYPPTLSGMDAFLIAGAVQGGISLVASVFYAASGGINPYFFGLLMAPIAGAYVAAVFWQRLKVTSAIHRKWREPIIVVLLLILILPGILAVPVQTAYEAEEDAPLRASDQEMFEWTGKYVQQEDRLLSDLNAISGLYYTTESPYNPAIVPTASAPNGTTTGIEGMETMFHDRPETAREVAEVYIITAPMVGDKMVFIDGAKLPPNRNLSSQLGSRSTFTKMYDADPSTIYGM